MAPVDDNPQAVKLVGCRENPRITNYHMAQKFCSIIPEEERKMTNKLELVDLDADFLVLKDHDIEVCRMPRAYAKEAQRCVDLYNTDQNPPEPDEWPAGWQHVLLHFEPTTGVLKFEGSENIITGMLGTSTMIATVLACLRTFGEELLRILEAVHTGGWNDHLRDRIGEIATHVQEAADVYKVPLPDETGGYKVQPVPELEQFIEHIQALMRGP
jgi:hypothetical protein